MAKSFIRKMNGMSRQLIRGVGKLQLLEQQHRKMQGQLQRLQDTLDKMEASMSGKTSLASKSSQDTMTADSADNEWDSSTVKGSGSDGSGAPALPSAVRVAQGLNTPEGGVLPPHILALRGELSWLMVEMEASDDFLDELSATLPSILTESDVESIRKEKRSSQKRRRVITRLQSLSGEEFEKSFLPVMARHQDHVAAYLQNQYNKCQGKLLPECFVCMIERELNPRSVGDSLHSESIINADNFAFISSDHIPPKVRWELIYRLLSKVHKRHGVWKCLLSAVPENRDDLLQFLKSATEKQIAKMKCECHVLFHRQQSLEKCKKWVSKLPLHGGISSQSMSPTESEDTEQEEANHNVKRNTNSLNPREAAPDSPEAEITGTGGGAPRGTLPKFRDDASPEGVSNGKPLQPSTVNSFEKKFCPGLPVLEKSLFSRKGSVFVHPTTEDVRTAERHTEGEGQQATPIKASDDVSKREQNVGMPNKTENMSRSPGLPPSEVHGTENGEQPDYPMQSDTTREQVSQNTLAKRQVNTVPMPIDPLEANTEVSQAKSGDHDLPTSDEQVLPAKTEDFTSTVDKPELMKKPPVPLKRRTEPSTSQVKRTERHPPIPRESSTKDGVPNESPHPIPVTSQTKASTPKVDKPPISKKPVISPKPKWMVHQSGSSPHKP